MAPALHLLWALLFHLSGILAVPVLNQTSISGPFSAGQSARLECQIRNPTFNKYHMYWYRQSPGEKPEWVLTYKADDSVLRGNGITDRFQPSRDTSTNSYFLTISSLEAHDFAVYYCAVWENDVGYFFGPGTILDITGSESLKPSVLLLPPPPEEIDSGSATLSCLVSRFKPGLLALSWSVDGVETKSGVSTGGVSLDTDQTYRLSSYLRIPAADWNKGSTYSCRVSHSSLSSPLRNTISSSTCAK